jgi:hypothetical protein
LNCGAAHAEIPALSESTPGPPDFLGGAYGPPAATSIDDWHAQVTRFTQAIFPGPVRIEPARDSEFGDRCFQVYVEATGSVEELLELNDRWHRDLVRSGVDAAESYCLSLVPRHAAS